MKRRRDPMVLKLPPGNLVIVAFKERATAKEIGVCIKLELPTPPYPPDHSIQMDLDMATWHKIVASVEKQARDIERGEYTTFREVGF